MEYDSSRLHEAISLVAANVTIAENLAHEATTLASRYKSDTDERRDRHARIDAANARWKETFDSYLGGEDHDKPPSRDCKTKCELTPASDECSAIASYLLVHGDKGEAERLFRAACDGGNEIGCKRGTRRRRQGPWRGREEESGGIFAWAL